MKCVSIVIVVRDNEDVSSRCLHSLLITTYRPLEVIVINNGGGKQIDSLLDRFGCLADAAGIRFACSRNENNTGASAARNQGLRMAAGDFIVFADNDIYTESGFWIDHLVKLLISRSEVAAIGPKLIYPFAPDIIQCAGGAINSKARVLLLGRGQSRYLSLYNRPREVQFYPTACLCMKRELIDRVGGFDEAYYPVQYEDVDLCYKVRQLGFQILYEPTIELFHYENMTSKFSRDARFTYNVIKNGVRFKSRWLETVLAEQDRFAVDEERVDWTDLHPEEVSR